MKRIKRLIVPLFMVICLAGIGCNSDQSLTPPDGDRRIQAELDIQEAVFRAMFKDSKIDEWHPMLRRFPGERNLDTCRLWMATLDPSGNFAERFKDQNSKFLVAKTPPSRGRPPSPNSLIIRSIKWESSNEVCVRTDNSMCSTITDFVLCRKGHKWSIDRLGYNAEYYPLYPPIKSRDAANSDSIHN